MDPTKLEGYDPRQYQKWMDQYHSKPYLNNYSKMKTVVKFLDKGISGVDVLFLQEAEAKQ